MLLSLLLLLLLVRASQASHFLGTMMTYYPEETFADGSVSVILRYKLNFVSCVDSDAWQCNGNCGAQTQTLGLSVVQEVSGEWCQREGAITRLLPNNTGFETLLAGGDWINSIQNGIVSWRAVTAVEMRNRSDIGKPNTSPQTTILPALRIPSNCAKNINLLAFDPDGDKVRCRYGNTSASECDPCTPPSVLSVSSNCSLPFSPTYSNTELHYAVQLVIEDFPTQNMNLIQTDGSQVVKTTNDAISKIPLQFVLKVGPPVPSCEDGAYLPRFLPPTPENRAQLFAPAGQALVINIRAEATQSVITGLLYSGPYNAVKNSSGSGNFSLTWTPSASEDGQSHPICFVVQANYSNTLLHSDLRCVIVTVGNSPTTTPIPAVASTNQTTLQTTVAPTTTTTTTTTTTPNLTVSAANQTILQSTAATIATTTTTPIPIVVSTNQTTEQTTEAPTTTTTTTTTPIPIVVSTNQTTEQTTVAITTATTTPTTLASTEANVTTSAPGPQYIIALNMMISTTLSLGNNSDYIITLIKNKLIEKGLPSTISLRLLSSGLVAVTTASP
ncbi:uncharacterized protein PB18E9.04c-like isoform X1 [Xiphophorus couchianus]|uniref:uncharacterized protein PB18E9.04c-like isoform X1 n=1 Tax=Xiphophorus couchianus TaxID=32473 RepID=UPI001016A98E|nr:uncharacterized protein PB18E9.04c-like isoform X1 [Xiphophorus couchianus]